MELEIEHDNYKVHVCDTSDGLDHIIDLEDSKVNILIIKVLKKR